MPTRSHAAAALAAGAALLALPAVASAAGPTVVAGPVKVKDYKMTLVANAGSMSVTLARTAGKATQTHFYSTAKQVKVKIPGSLASGTVKAPLGPLGAVRLKLHATGPLKRSAPPAGCTGANSRSRSAVLKGTLRLKADGGRYFGTIVSRSLPARVIAAGKIKCNLTPGTPGQGGGTPNTTILSRSLSEGGQLTAYTAMKSAGKVTQSVTRMDAPAATAPVQVMHLISVTGGAFDVAGDYSSASVTGAGKFLTGKLAFASDSAFGSGASGTATGDLVAKFDPLGRISLTAGDAPTLISSY
jgi:hypothetical protein